MFENPLMTMLFWSIILLMVALSRTLFSVFFAGFIASIVGATQAATHGLALFLYILSGLCLVSFILSLLWSIKVVKNKEELKKNKDGFPILH